MVCIITASRGGTAFQISTPILVGIVLCLAFALLLLYHRGRLSYPTSILHSMRRRRQARHRWTIDGDGPSDGTLHHVPDAEATPMIDPLHHWRTLSPHDDDRQRLSTRIGMGILTPAFSKGIRSIRRLFGWGPAGNVLGDGGADDHNNELDARNQVMLISRDGEDFSLRGSMNSVPLGRRSTEVDRRSIEVVPPSPRAINKQVSRIKSPQLA